jgi:cell division protease FtsH
MGMYRKTRLNFGSLAKDRSGGGREFDSQTRSLMEAQSERLYSETRTVLLPLKPLTEHLVARLLQAGEMGLAEALSEIRSFEALQTG